MLNERVEEIGRLHEGLKRAGCQEVPLYWIDDLLTALVQAEREREEWKHECHDWMNKWRDDLQEARAEVERLKGDKQIQGFELSAAHGHQEEAEQRAEQAEAALARVRAALQQLYDETADYIRINHLGDVHHNHAMKMARAALEGRK